MQAALWGNATVRSIPPPFPLSTPTNNNALTPLCFQDLSLLVDLKYSDLQKLQAVGAKAQAENAQYILRNDFGRVWEHLKTQKAGKVDIVLDNGAYILFFRSPGERS